MRERTIHSKFLFNQNDLPAEFNSPIIVAYQLKTPENIGNIIRLADNFGSKRVLFVSNDENSRNSKIKKTASSSYNSVDWNFCKESELEVIIPSDYKWIAIETSSDSKNIYKVSLPKKVALIVGNEISGINEGFLAKCSEIVHIPLYGNNTSMNVSHALAAALSEWQRQILD